MNRMKAIAGWPEVAGGASFANRESTHPDRAPGRCAWEAARVLRFGPPRGGTPLTVRLSLFSSRGPCPR